VKPKKSSGRCRSDVLRVQSPSFISRGVLRATLIALCFVLADYLHINILKFVAGHGTVIHSACSVVFGYQQA